ncbi:MAG TPA: hypothetical protein VKT12_01825 [Candidatus Binataceae bacterium]|nr:hypothetical protein [Candidatus Binataceae bacterium]
MGTWGTGLYSGDLAMDLRSTIAAVARLPFEGDRLAEIVCATEPGVANNPDDEEHTVFWLVVADQFARRAIGCARVREKALAIIDDGADLAMHAKRGMSSADLRKRQKMLAEVRERVTAAVAGRVRYHPARSIAAQECFILSRLIDISQRIHRRKGAAFAPGSTAIAPVAGLRPT